MGQDCSVQTPRLLQRINPTPGSTGLRLRKKNTVSVYSEATHAIHTFKVDFDLPVRQLKALVPGGAALQFAVDDQVLNDEASLRELGVTEKTLLRVVCLTATSTADNSGEDWRRNIGPKPLGHRKPVQPREESSLTFAQSAEWPLDGPAFAVPDVQLSVRPGRKKTFK